jgi:uncharacterized membrane protein YciS (DUF1049 family)
MRFLTSLFWIIVAVLVITLAIENWNYVTINLWGDLQADIRIPVLLAITFLLGFLPAYLIYRTRLWRLRKQVAVPRPVPAGPAASDSEEFE